MTCAGERSEDLHTSGEDALLLREFSHRTANEIAAAAAALHLVEGLITGRARDFVEDAAGRLRAFGKLHNVLARPIPPRAEVGADLTAVCRAVGARLPGTSGSVISLDVGETWVDGRTARRLVLIGAELVSNAVRHALSGRTGRLEVSLEVAGSDIVLEVRDDGPGMRPGASTSGTGYGGGIVAELVERARGRLSVDSGRSGTAVRVALPLTDGDEDYAF